MKSQQIKKFRSDVARSINEGRLHDAFAAMRSFSEGVMSWEITTEIDSLEQNYRAMLSFMVNGAEDPGRDAMLASIAADARALADSLSRRALIPEENTLYFSTARSLATRQGESVTRIIDDLRCEYARLRQDIVSIAQPSRTVKAENLVNDLFNRLWSTHPLSVADLEAAYTFITDPDEPFPSRAVAVSAITAGALEFYDAARVEMLLRVYMAQVEEAVSIRALLGFFLVTFRYRRRPMPARVMAALAAAKDFPLWNSDLKTAAIEFMRSRDTERITRRLNDDILPSLSRIAPEIRDKFTDGNPVTGFDPDGANPDWEELLNRDGLGDKLREMSEIQADGGDVYMSSFSSLKHFPFFRDIANWFLPFSDDHSAVAALDSPGVADTVASMPFLCDNDKFSVMLAIGTAPSHVRDGAAAAMNAQAGQMREMLSEIEKFTDASRRKSLISNYVRDLYRFYNLFRRKGEFFNPFNHNIDLMAIDAISDGFNDLETLKVIAEFNLKHQFWTEALALLTRVDRIAEPDAARAQKIGFCHEKLGDYNRAISHYDEARLLGGSGKWLLTRIAHVFAALGQHTRAIEALKELVQMEPDSPDVAYALALAYIEGRHPDYAVPLLHKVLYLTPDSLKGRRAFAWAMFLCGRFDRAREAYGELLALSPTPDDYFNAGHTARATGDIREAVNYYTLAMISAGKSVADLESDLEADTPWLAHAGVDTSLNRLIIESILYNSNKN